MRQLLATCGPFARSHAARIAAAAVLVVASTGTALLRPWPLKVLFDEVLIPGRRSGDPQFLLLAIVGAMAGIAMLDGLLTFLSQYLLTATGQQMAFELRCALYGQLHRLSLAYHDRQRTGDLITRITTDIDRVVQFLTENVVQASANILKLAGMAAVMFWLDTQLAIASLGLVPLLLLAIVRFRRIVEQGEQHARRQEGDIASLVQDTLTSIRLVKVFGQERHEGDRFATHSAAAVQANLMVSRAEAGFGWLMDALTAIALAGLVWLGAQRVFAGSLTAGDLLIFISYIRDFYDPTRSLARLSGRVSRASVRARKIAEVLDEVPVVRDLPDARPAPPLRGGFRFEHVSFSYVPGLPVVSDVDLEVSPGQTVALVGPTGAGKSTIAALIPRLYDPTAGRVLVDGQDVRSYTLASLRAQISVVMQDTLLLRATLRENIAYGRPGASQAAIVAAARAANAHEFISTLPDGYDTVIGERGQTLSGGQRQRLAIARALVRDAPILILDEPTTGLDAGAERQVVDALDRLMAGRTTVVITHRLATIRHAHIILVIAGGQVVERGTHEELLALGRRYAELCRLQGLVPDPPPLPQPAAGVPEAQDTVSAQAGSRGP